MSLLIPVVLTVPGSDPAEVLADLWSFLELWQPALLKHWQGLPSLAPVEEHAQPKDGHFYLVRPRVLDLLTDGWRQQAEQAGSRMLATDAEGNSLRSLVHRILGEAEVVEPEWPFLGVGYGCWVLDQLADAMAHGNPLDEEGLFETLRLAASTPDAARHKSLAKAADTLRAARDVLYPSTLHLLTIVLLGADGWKELPEVISLGTPANLVCGGEALSAMAKNSPRQVAALRQAMEAKTIELCGGGFANRPVSLLPTEAYLADQRRGHEAALHVLSAEFLVQASPTFGAHPLWPEVAHSFGRRHALLLSFDGANVPSFKGAVLEWPNAAGKTLQTFVRQPRATSDPATWTHMAKHLHETIMQDFAAQLVFAAGQAENPACKAWLALHQLAPVFGQPITLTHYFSETYASDHPPSLPIDEFRAVDQEKWLSEEPNPCSQFVDEWRLDATTRQRQAIAGLIRGLTGPANMPLAETETLSQLAERLASRVLRRATERQAGFLIFNTTGFSRTAIVELPGALTPMPPPARATSLGTSPPVASVELPPLGFSWLPREIASGTKVHQPRINLGEELRLRNEFLELELDSATGFVLDLRDSKRRISRCSLGLGGSADLRAVAKQVRLVAAGPAVGEIVADGELLDASGATAGEYRLSYRLGWGIPFATVRVRFSNWKGDVPAGEYLGLRLNWRDGSAELSRSMLWYRASTRASAPESPGFLEVQSGSQRLAVLTGGLPFWRRSGPRQADLLLLASHETCREFEVAIAVDQASPHALLEDWLSPPVTVPVDQGPPPGGPQGWFFDLDSSQILLTSLEPESQGDAVVVRLVETHGVSGEAQLRCPRQPVNAEVIDELGRHQAPLTTVDDTVFLHFAPNEMMRIRLTFST